MNDEFYDDWPGVNERLNWSPPNQKIGKGKRMISNEKNFCQYLSDFKSADGTKALIDGVKELMEENHRLKEINEALYQILYAVVGNESKIDKLRAGDGREL